MGQFLCLSGVIGSSEKLVADALRTFAKEHEGTFEPASLTLDDKGCLIILEGTGGVTVLYPGEFMSWDAASAYLSKALDKPVFSLHIHDGDLWMYLLFENGVVVDQFNPVPDYWSDELDEAERRAWQGNVAEIVTRVSGVKAEELANYLITWDPDTEDRKAYPTDEFAYGDDWQMTDFMRRLGLDFPIDDRGAPHGVSYRFQVEIDES